MPKKKMFQKIIYLGFLYYRTVQIFSLSKNKIILFIRKYFPLHSVIKVSSTRIANLFLSRLFPMSFFLSSRVESLSFKAESIPQLKQKDRSLVCHHPNSMLPSSASGKPELAQTPQPLL